MAIKKTTKTATKKVAAKKTPAKKAAKKVAAKKAVTTPAKKVATKKAPAKTVVEKAPAQKPAPKKSPNKKAVKTTIIANVDVGFGNSLYIRGEGAGLSWNKGTQLENVSPYEWAFSTTTAKSGITFKLLINDQNWAEGENLTVSAGGTSVSSPIFHW